jgi:GT2 family glycosyltransferase
MLLASPAKRSKPKNDRMDYSIIIPVFNKAELTRNCLRTLRDTLAGAGTGEVIVIDNASSDETPEMLAEFPWATIVRNERNLGFAGANNQGARLAKGRFLVLLNNDTQGFPGWLAAMLEVAREPEVGAVGARLLFPNNTIQHAGVIVAGNLFGRGAFSPFHCSYGVPATDPSVMVRREYQIVTGACLVTPRELYLDLGGLDEIYWNGYEDVDYCLKVRERGLKVVYEPKAALYHFESQSGAQRFRKVWWNVRTLTDRWRGKVRFDSSEHHVGLGRIAVLECFGDAFRVVARATPPTPVLVHGVTEQTDRAAFEKVIRANRSPVTEIRWATIDDALKTARDMMAIRGDRFLALVDARTQLVPGWLDELVAQATMITNVAAATFAPELPPGENVGTLGADARCTLLVLRQFPQHLELGEFDTLDGAVADLLMQALELERGTRVARAMGVLPKIPRDASFERVRGMPLAGALDTSSEAVESVLRARPTRSRGLASIVTLSWNAPDYTKKALVSIRERTSEPYEVIVVDNGSDAATREMLAAIDDPHVRVIYNETNRGYAGGNNDGIAVARGDYVVLLNNDVIVTDGWLDGLLDPFARQPGIGVTAPRSNIVVGHQQLAGLSYSNEKGMHAFASERTQDFAGSGYFADRAIGLCLCIDRTVLEQVGGLDERFGLGNFEDDDFCIRVRAAGYSIYVCNDVFIHHFGSRSFAANKVDYSKTMSENWKKFSEKWGFPPAMPTTGYNGRDAYSKGFDRKKHFFGAAPDPVQAVTQGAADERDAALLTGARVAFFANVRGEDDWQHVSQFVTRFAKAFRLEDRALLVIGTFGDASARTVGTRVERIFSRLNIDLEAAADVIVSDEDELGEWSERMAAAGAVEFSTIGNSSPSALRRMTATR